VLLVLALVACDNSKIPDDALFYDVVVNAEDVDDDSFVDTCHPDATIPGYTETFTYAVAFEGSKATIWVDESIFAVGTITGCDLTYTTVVFGEESDADGALKWQLTGVANVDPAEGDACVEGTDDWQGYEIFEIISSEEETLEPGCTYETSTLGTFVSGE
jgi:hypothetical protein